MITFLIHACLLVSGYFFAFVLGIKNKLEALAVGYFLGSGIVSVLFLLNHWLLKIPLDGMNFVVAVFLAILASLLALYKQKKIKLLQIQIISPKKLFINNKSLLENGLILVLLSIVLYSFLHNYATPVSDWDSLALYDFRAIVIARTGNLVEGIELGYFFQYPPYTSFLHAFSYIFDTARVKVGYSMIFASFLLSFYVLLRRKQKNWLALLGVFVLATDISIFEHAIVAYNNLAYVAFYSLGIIYLWHWFVEAKKKDLFIGSLLVGFSTWIRASEPFWVLAVLIILIKTIGDRKLWKEALISMLVIITILKTWGLYTRQLYFVHQFEAGLNANNLFDKLISQALTVQILLGKFFESTLYFWKNVIAVIRPFLLPFILAIIADFQVKKVNNLILFFFFLVLFLIIWAGTFIFSLFYVTWDLIGGSLQRVSMPLIPLMCFLIFSSSIWQRPLHKK
jgi:hypothetical protein